MGELNTVACAVTSVEMPSHPLPESRRIHHQNASDPPQSRMPSNAACNCRMSTELARREDEEGDMGLPVLCQAAEHVEAPSKEEGISAAPMVAKRVTACQAASEAQRGGRELQARRCSFEFSNYRMGVEQEKRKEKMQFCPHGLPMQAKQKLEGTPHTEPGWSGIAAVSGDTGTPNGSNEPPDAGEVAAAEKRAKVIQERLIQERLSRAANAKEQLLAAMEEAAAAGMQAEKIVGHAVSPVKASSIHVSSRYVDEDETDDFIV